MSMNSFTWNHKLWLQVDISRCFHSFNIKYPRWELNPQNLAFETSTYANSVTRAYVKERLVSQIVIPCVGVIGIEPTYPKGDGFTDRQAYQLTYHSHFNILKNSFCIPTEIRTQKYTPFKDAAFANFAIGTIVCIKQKKPVLIFVRNWFLSDFSIV